MTRQSASQSWRLEHGDCIALMAGIPESSVDAIVCDPPYGLEFMGKDWDGADGFRRSLNEADVDRPNVFGRASRTGPEYRAGRLFQEWCETWATEALRVLRPGGYMLAFGGTRTYHRLVSGIEDAGFEVRDQVAWIYGSGFPKHESCLKPAHEPVALARKASRYSEPLQIDAARIGIESHDLAAMQGRSGASTPNRVWSPGIGHEETWKPEAAGRWPANVVLDEEAAAMLDEQSGASVSRVGNPRGAAPGEGWGMTATGAEYDDAGGASRFFYVAKPDKTERNVGLDERNPHPTVKPVELMRWLCRLVTPKGGTVLDPFTGSGTTGIAAMREGFSFIGCEQDKDYVDVARARILGDAPLLNGAFEEAA